MLHEFCWAMNIYCFSKHDLRNDGTDLSAGSRDTMSSRTVPCRKHLARYDESGDIRSKIQKEVEEAVQKEKCF